MSIYNRVRDLLGYGEVEVAARQARLEAQKLEDERLQEELYMKFIAYEITNNDTSFMKLFNWLRYHPSMRHAYIEPLIVSILLALIRLAPVLELFGKH